MIALILLAPLLAAIVAVAVSKNTKLPKYIALAASVISLVLLPLISSGTSSIGWFSVNSYEITLTVSVAPLNFLLLFLVLFIAPLIFAYSFGYITPPSEQRRYYVEMLAFEAAMLAFAMSGNFVLLFIAWEFLSLTSYLLIGFWYTRDRATRAARKAITIILIGDLALLGAIVIFQNAFGTLEFGGIISGIASTGAPAIGVFLLLVAIMTKSAQFPFHEWLPDAMEGPTPVSAFLHSTTMVKAGVFVAIVLFPVFSAANYLGVLLVVGMITAILGMLNALREHHVKRILAYSTMQELGIMLICVGGNALLAAIYFFFAQSFYKALSFFSAGVTMKATEKEDITEMAGLGQNRMVYITTLFGVLALAGFIPFDGFFANAGIGSAFSTNLGVYVVVTLLSLGTSFYIFRWFTLLSRKNTNARTALNYNSIPKSMSYGMLILACATLAASVGFFYLPEFLSGTASSSVGTSLGINFFDAVVGLAVAVIGAYAAYTIYKQKTKRDAPVTVPKILDLMYTAGVVNAAYEHTAAFVDAVAGGVAYFDSELNGAFDALGHLAVRSANSLRGFAAGEINAYVGIFVAGLILLIILVVVV